MALCKVHLLIDARLCRIISSDEEEEQAEWAGKHVEGLLIDASPTMNATCNPR